jgi:hypothetical protein
MVGYFFDRRFINISRLKIISGEAVWGIFIVFFAGAGRVCRRFSANMPDLYKTPLLGGICPHIFLLTYFTKNQRISRNHGYRSIKKILTFSLADIKFNVIYRRFCAFCSIIHQLTGYRSIVRGVY